MTRLLVRVAILVIGIIALVGAAAGGAVFGKGLSKPPSTVTAQRIEIVDQAGTVRLVLGVEGGIPTIRMLTIDGQQETLGLRSFDQMSVVRAVAPGSLCSVSMGIAYRGSPFITITNDRGCTLFGAAATYGRNPELLISRGEDQPGPSIALRLDDSNGPQMEARDDEGQMVWAAPSTTNPAPE